MTDIANIVTNITGGRLTVNLAALCENYTLLAGIAAPARTAAVVKADAYGLGAAQVVPALERAGCRDFFIAHLTEALAIRSLLSPHTLLYILNGLQPGSEEICAQANCIPVLNGVEQVANWIALAKSLDRKLPAIVQIDSGMSRLGLSPDDAIMVARDKDFQTHIDLRFVMSHLACADHMTHNANEAQRRAFEHITAHFPATPLSLANSGGIFLGADFHDHLVRPGIALYGAAPNDSEINPMHRVVTLEARVIQTRAIPTGTGIGYGHSIVADRDMHIATIALGYADGWPRCLGNIGAAWFGGVRLPIIGRVSMDSIILDVSALPPGTLKLGDYVEMIGEHQSLDQVAADAGTISYEILTSLGHRYERVYLT